MWWCVRQGKSPSFIGTLPYAITDWTYRLSMGLAEHRRWPDNTVIQTKCLVYAGLLAHYAQDACMPLHATIHWDGRAEENGDSPHTGIHNRVDALLQKVSLNESPLLDANEIPFDSVLAACFAQLQASNRLVDTIYAWEDAIPEADRGLDPKSPIWSFMQERLRESALFTARLYVTAWGKSLDVTMPEWHERSAPIESAASSSRR